MSAAAAPLRAAPPAPRAERAWSGVRDVVRFNARTYAVAAGAIAWLLAASAWLPSGSWARAACLAAAGLAAWWAVASVAAIAWVYDLSRLRRWSWLRTEEGLVPGRWVVLHAGHDTEARTVAAACGGGGNVVVDLFDPREGATRSIRVARAAAGGKTAPGDVEAPWIRDGGRLPLPSASADAVVAPYALHEVRDPAARRRLFAEIARVLRPGGDLVVVEHDRDAANVLAFGPGSLHFLPARAWFEAAAMAGLEPVRNRRITPFVRVMRWRRPGGEPASLVGAQAKTRPSQPVRRVDRADSILLALGLALVAGVGWTGYDWLVLFTALYFPFLLIQFVFPWFRFESTLFVLAPAVVCSLIARARVRQPTPRGSTVPWFALLVLADLVGHLIAAVTNSHLWPL